MTLIVDSGSTKSDWVVLDQEGKEVLRTETVGLNPYFISTKEIGNEISKNEELSKLQESVAKVFFYGAGCSSNKMNTIVEKALNDSFVNASIMVKHDLLAAAYAAYNGKPAIVCILGTGSNSCYFDGEKLYEETPSLAYILGDEGSGNNLGKRILQAFFLKKMPKRLHQAFQERYNLTTEELNKNVYQNQFANTYLATFSRFVSDHKYEPFIQQLIYSGLKEFFINQVLPYKEARFSEINFIGSVAHYYEEILYAVAAEFHLRIGFVIRKPIDNLVKYHLLYILPNILPKQNIEIK